MILCSEHIFGRSYFLSSSNSNLDLFGSKTGLILRSFKPIGVGHSEILLISIVNLFKTKYLDSK